MKKIKIVINCNFACYPCKGTSKIHNRGKVWIKNVIRHKFIGTHLTPFSEKTVFRTKNGDACPSCAERAQRAYLKDSKWRKARDPNDFSAISEFMC